DPLGIGGLLFDASRIAQLMVLAGFGSRELLERVLDAALIGLHSFDSRDSLGLPAGYRLAFRELGLSIGLSAVERLWKEIEENPTVFDDIKWRIQSLEEYMPLKDAIELFWLDGRNREAVTWTEYQDINRVMLATSLAPGEFLKV
ncbi:MAG TPA: hypothetical protein VE134_08395, partial [Methanomicrobiales archaeon]|nr:hypothetical protein [Methanomicrobiales archaeon]